MASRAAVSSREGERGEQRACARAMRTKSIGCSEGLRCLVAAPKIPAKLGVVRAVYLIKELAINRRPLPPKDLERLSAYRRRQLIGLKGTAQVFSGYYIFFFVIKRQNILQEE